MSILMKLVIVLFTAMSLSCVTSGVNHIRATPSWEACDDACVDQAAMCMLIMCEVSVEAVIADEPSGEPECLEACYAIYSECVSTCDSST